MPRLTLWQCAGLLLVVAVAALEGCGPAPSRGAPRSADGHAETDARSWEELGDQLMKQGDTSRAAQYYEAALLAGAPRALPKLLAACVASRQYALAVEHAEAALARDPANEHLRALLGSLHADTGELARARADFEQAALERPADADLQFTVAVFFRDDVHEPGRADAYFRAYLAVAPSGRHAREAHASLMKRVE